MVYSGAWGKLIHEKNQKSKISWNCPFNIFSDANQKKECNFFFSIFVPLFIIRSMILILICTCAANFSFAQLAKGKKSRP